MLFAIIHCRARTDRHPPTRAKRSGLPQPSAFGCLSPHGCSAASDARILWSSLIVGALLVILAVWSSSLEYGSGAVTSRR